MAFKPGIKQGSKSYIILKYMQDHPTIHPEWHYFDNVGWFWTLVLWIPKVQYWNSVLAKLKKKWTLDSYLKPGGYNGVEHCYFLTGKHVKIL